MNDLFEAYIAALTKRAVRGYGNGRFAQAGQVILSDRGRKEGKTTLPDPAGSAYRAEQ